MTEFNKRFRAVASTTKPDTNGRPMSLAGLEKFVGHKEYIFADFLLQNEPVGFVDTATIQDGVLVVEGSIMEEYVNKGLFIVISLKGTMIEGSHGKAIDPKTIEPMFYGLVLVPSDTGLTPLEAV